MGDGTPENSYTSEDVREAIRKKGTAEGLDLSGKTFEDSIDLSHCNLGGIILRKAVFKHGTVSPWSGAHLEEADLTNAQLDEADLWQAHLEGVYLPDAHLKGAKLGYAHLEGANLWKAHLEGATLWEAHLKGAILCEAHLEGTNFRDAHLEGAYLGSLEFPRDTRLEDADWGNYVIGEEEDHVPLSRRLSLTMAEATYRRLKIWYTEHGMYDLAGKFFYREMEAKRKAQSWKKEPASKLWSWVIRLLCGYGERYGNVVVAALVVIFGLAVVYVFGGLNLAYAIYFSAVSFTALGYGSWVPQPTGWVKGLGVAESFIGVFMMALFLVTFTREMTR